MTDNNSPDAPGNLYVASTLAILFMLSVAAIVWFTQVRPSAAEQVVVESPPVDTSALAPTPVASTIPAQISTGNPAAGQALFVSCTACHGPTGEGIPGLGKDLTSSEFVSGKTDDELISFIKVGRDPNDPLNTTGIAMPPKGGNPALGDDDLYNIVAYLRTIHK
jgi:mono/diheme cytochrome c family protein